MIIGEKRTVPLRFSRESKNKLGRSASRSVNSNIPAMPTLTKTTVYDYVVVETRRLISETILVEAD